MHQVSCQMVILFKSFTSKSLIEFDKNPNYWDKDNVKIRKSELSSLTDRTNVLEVFLDGNYTDGRIFNKFSLC